MDCNEDDLDWEAQCHINRVEYGKRIAELKAENQRLKAEIQKMQAGCEEQSLLAKK